MQLYKAVLISAFGGRGRRPFRVAMVRVSLVGLLAASSGMALAHTAQQLPVLEIPHSYTLVPSALLAMEIVVVCTLLAASGVLQRLYTDGFARWLLFLPVGRLQRWAILMTPSIVLALLAVLLATWPLGQLWIRMGMTPALVAIASVAGAVCALGLCHALPPRLALLRFVLIPYVLWVQYKLVNTIGVSGEYVNAVSVYTFAALVILLCCTWLWSSRYTHTAVSRSRQVDTVCLSKLPVRWWYIKKCIRSPAIRLSWLTGLGLVIAVATADRHFSLGTPTVGLASAIVIAAFTSDIRALSRLVAPAEIVALQGSNYFVTMHVAAAFVCSGLIALPLCMYLGGLSGTLASNLCMGVTTGLFAGCVIAPSPRDISGQFVSGLLCIGILGLVPNLLGANLSPGIQPVLHLGLSLLLLIATYLVEYKRNPYTWRNRHYG